MFSTPQFGGFHEEEELQRNVESGGIFRCSAHAKLLRIAVTLHFFCGGLQHTLTSEDLKNSCRWIWMCYFTNNTCKCFKLNPLKLLHNCGYYRQSGSNLKTSFSKNTDELFALRRKFFKACFNEIYLNCSSLHLIHFMDV